MLAPNVNRLRIHSNKPFSIPLSLSSAFVVPHQNVAGKLHLAVMLR